MTCVRTRRRLLFEQASACRSEFLARERVVCFGELLPCLEFRPAG